MNNTVIKTLEKINYENLKEKFGILVAMGILRQNILSSKNDKNTIALGNLYKELYKENFENGFKDNVIIFKNKTNKKDIISIDIIDIDKACILFVYNNEVNSSIFYEMKNGDIKIDINGKKYYIFKTISDKNNYATFFNNLKHDFNDIVK
jgi:hypothetical protein